MAWSAPDPGDDHEDEKDKEQDSPELVCSQEVWLEHGKARQDRG